MIVEAVWECWFCKERNFSFLMGKDVGNVRERGRVRLCVLDGEEELKEGALVGKESTEKILYFRAKRKGLWVWK